ncbi:DUF86 domain-containing protein [Populibacterium corticicola]|uniref:DUF86 domain-containing protein n=1 Tax=Populibacterium corticicola TaxID=1812826 RepID=A0ABW5XDY3_9MICO
MRDDLLQAGVERKLEIVGEALGKLRRFFPDLAENIAGLNQAVGMRNVLAHEYGTVNPIMVWDTVQLHVPDLIVVLIALERELEGGQ